MTVNGVAKKILTLVIAVGICLLAGYIGGYPALSTTPMGIDTDLHITGFLGGYPGMLAGSTPPVPEWYTSLAKPVFSPPVWIFSPLWLISFLLMGFSLFLILQSGVRQRDVTFGLILFCLQLLFMLVWAYAFFGLHAIFLAFMCIIALWATLLCAVIQVFRFSVYGGMLLVPYFLWVCYLAYLNYGIMTINNLVFVI